MAPSVLLFTIFLLHLGFGSITTTSWKFI